MPRAVTLASAEDTQAGIFLAACVGEQGSPMEPLLAASVLAVPFTAILTPDIPRVDPLTGAARRSSQTVAAADGDTTAGAIGGVIPGGIRGFTIRSGGEILDLLTTKTMNGTAIALIA